MENEKKKLDQLGVENHRLLMHFLQALIKEQNLLEVPHQPVSPSVARTGENVANLGLPLAAQEQS